MKPRLDQLDSEEQRLKNERQAWERAQHEDRRKAEEREKDWAKSVEQDKLALGTLARQKSEGFPWLAQAYADYFHLQDMRLGRHLEFKKRPAKKAAEDVREIASKRRTAEKLWRVLKYQLEYYETLFPWLVDFKGEELDNLVTQLILKTTSPEPESVDDEEDPVRHWLTKAEYESLSVTERNQLALNRYWQKKKTSWELGRDYERFIGYQYEIQGWHVRYQGIVEGLADLGRDLIASRGNQIDIVQCKYWRKERQIHETHIFQLYGTVVAYEIDNPGAQITSAFITSTYLSPRARQFADVLGIRRSRVIPWRGILVSSATSLARTMRKSTTYPWISNMTEQWSRKKDLNVTSRPSQKRRR